MSLKNLSVSSDTSSDPNAYWISGAVIAASLLVGIGITLFPQTAGAFWPFSVLNAAETSLVHDSSIALLEAPENSDPSPAPHLDDIETTEGSALMANSGLDGSIPDVEHTTGGSISTYTVQAGDSISDISTRTGVSVDTILWANGLTRKSAIKTGMTLVVLPVSGVRHTVQKGETLAGLAKKFGADTADIASYNGVDAGSGLTAGTELIIPGGELPAIVKVVSKPKTEKISIKVGGSLKNVKANPYRGGSGTEIDGFFGNPLPGSRLTQGIHGWNGVDIGAPSGTPIHAAAAGTVIVSRADGWNGGYGNYVVIDHGNGVQTLYSHLSVDNVSVGQSVSQGALLGTVGRTGSATGNHLHFEVRGARNPFADCAEMSFCSPK